MTVGDVIPSWPTWNEADEQDLAWDSEEEAWYSDLAYGQDNRRYNQHGQAATVVHSLRNALRQCPSGCRVHPFSDMRLIKARRPTWSWCPVTCYQAAEVPTSGRSWTPEMDSLLGFSMCLLQDEP